MDKRFKMKILFEFFPRSVLSLSSKCGRLIESNAYDLSLLGYYRRVNFLYIMSELRQAIIDLLLSKIWTSY